MAPSLAVADLEKFSSEFSQETIHPADMVL
jgi:hypothetical protein